jgi:hypothetical protein
MFRLVGPSLTDQAGNMDLMRLPTKQPCPTDANVNIHSLSKDMWFGMVAIIDSGTKENWISVG